MAVAERTGPGTEPPAPPRTVVQTGPRATDPRLRGRTYGVPFERVWTAVLGLVTDHPRWTVLRADDQEGVIHALARNRLLRREDPVTIHVSLDRDAQTRVDMVSATSASRDLGVGPRRIARFVRSLDRRLAAPPPVPADES